MFWNNLKGKKQVNHWMRLHHMSPPQPLLVLPLYRCGAAVLLRDVSCVWLMLAYQILKHSFCPWCLKPDWCTFQVGSIILPLLSSCSQHHHENGKWVWKDLFIWIISYCQYYGPQTFAMGPHSSTPNLNKFKTSSNQTIYINFSFFLVGCWKLFILFVLYDELFSLKYALRRGLPL